MSRLLHTLRLTCSKIEVQQEVSAVVTGFIDNTKKNFAETTTWLLAFPTDKRQVA